MAGFLPFACLLVTNTVLVRKVGQSLREARDNLAEGRSDPFVSRDKKLSSMTITLIATSVAFLVLTSPVVVYTIWYGSWHMTRCLCRQFLSVLSDRGQIQG